MQIAALVSPLRVLLVVIPEGDLRLPWPLRLSVFLLSFRSEAEESAVAVVFHSHRKTSSHTTNIGHLDRSYSQPHRE